MKLATAAVLLACAVSIHASDDVHVVVANLDGTRVPANLPLTDVQVAGAAHIWAWTGELSPRKLPPNADVATQLGKQTPHPLEIRVRGWSRPEDLAGVRAIVAPVEMWADVPEPLLPSFAVSKDGRATVHVRDPVHIRLIGERLGTTWERVARGQRSIDVTLRKPVLDATLTFRTHDGRIPASVLAVARNRRPGDPKLASQAIFSTDEKGVLRIPALPEAEVLSLFIVSDGSAPQSVSGTAADLTRTFRFAPGMQVRGKFVDEDGRPLADVQVDAEGFAAADAPSASRSSARSDQSGRWVVRNLPKGRVVVRASAAGRGTYVNAVDLDAADVDLGTIEMSPSIEIVLEVTDADGRPISGVAVETDAGFRGKTNEAGKVKVDGLAADGSSGVTLTASGFEKQTLRLAPPLPKEERVVLERAFSIRGRVVRDDDAAARDAIIVVTAGSSYKRESVSQDGTFAFDAHPGADLELSFESPTTLAVTRNESAGRAGEIRDLGTIHLPAGSSVRGRVVDEAGAPVGGARIWSTRPGPGGVLTAWTSGRLVQATSDADGTFEVRGLAEGRVLLRFDAVDSARAYRDVLVDATPFDLGAIPLARGGVVKVSAVSDDGGVARVDLRGQSLDADMLTAPLVDGEARVRNVPSGRFNVTVARGPTIVCERNVDVVEGRESVVRCPPPPVVRGRVVIGGVPAIGGTLTWAQPSKTDSMVENRISPLGARQQKLYGVGGGSVVVPVRTDGSFETNQLRAGEWQVGWRSTDSSGTPERAFTIPDAAEASVVVTFDGGVIRGRVVDKRGDAVAGAIVREIQGPSYARVSGDGAFTMTGVAPGVHRLQATLGARASRIVQVEVAEGRQAPEIVLELAASDEHDLTVRVIGAGGEPRSGAFVFVETAGGVLKALTADANGIATITVAEGLPAVARIVAYAGDAWAFGEMRRPEDGGLTSATVRFVPLGGIEIRSRTMTGTPALLSSRVPGDLAWMLSRIGTFLRVEPGRSLLIRGLPPGVYELRVADVQTAVSVTAGQTAVIDLR